MKITTMEAAQILGIARRTVQKWCAELDFERVGRDYLLTDDQLAQIRAVAQDAPGRPRQSRNA